MNIGDRVLWIEDMSVAWTVTEIDLLFAGDGHMITAEYREPDRAPAKLTQPCWMWVPAPPGWRDCPPAPDPWNHLTHLMRNDDAFYEEVDEWEGQRVVWEMDHVRPLLLRLQRDGR
jgi:hypothetical protein